LNPASRAAPVHQQFSEDSASGSAAEFPARVPGAQRRARSISSDGKRTVHPEILSKVVFFDGVGSVSSAGIIHLRFDPKSTGMVTGCVLRYLLKIQGRGLTSKEPILTMQAMITGMI
jgi:hypothetical protein